MLLTAYSMFDLEISFMQVLSSFWSMHKSPRQGLQYLIMIFLSPLGAVTVSFPTPKKDTVGMPNAAEI